MKFDLREKPKDYEGKNIKIGQEQSEETYQTLFTIALNNFNEDERPGAEEKAKLFALSIKVNSTHDPQLTPSEITRIIERVEKVFPSPLIYGRVREYLGEPVQLEDELKVVDGSEAA